LHGITSFFFRKNGYREEREREKEILLPTAVQPVQRPSSQYSRGFPLHGKVFYSRAIRAAGET
jgi:hypothetical protein